MRSPDLPMTYIWKIVSNMRLTISPCDWNSHLLNSLFETAWFWLLTHEPTVTVIIDLGLVSSLGIGMFLVFESCFSSVSNWYFFVLHTCVKESLQVTKRSLRMTKFVFSTCHCDISTMRLRTATLAMYRFHVRTYMISKPTTINNLLGMVGASSLCL